jgi:uncharacterized coiled-coil DUF342 family protein
VQELLIMSEAHLTNVRQQIERLNEQRDNINNEIEQLNKYFTEGVSILEKYRSEIAERASTDQDTP